MRVSYSYPSLPSTRRPSLAAGYTRPLVFILISLVGRVGTWIAVFVSIPCPYHPEPAVSLIHILTPTTTSAREDVIFLVMSNPGSTPPGTRNWEVQSHQGMPIWSVKSDQFCLISSTAAQSLTKRLTPSTRSIGRPSDDEVTNSILHAACPAGSSNDCAYPNATYLHYRERRWFVFDSGKGELGCE